MQADDTSIMLPAVDGSLHVAYSNGLSEEMRRQTFAAGERIASRISRDRRAVILNGDVRGDDRFHDLAPLRSVRSSIVYPLCTGDRVLGVLNVNRVAAERKLFKPDDLERLAVLAAQIVLALEVHELLRQLTASERFASIGQLASGIAHEINNPVSYVMSNVQYCREVLAGLDAGDASWSAELAGNLRTALADAEEGAARIRDVIRDMRSMTRNAKQVTAVFDIGDAVNAALRVTSADVRSCAEVTTELDSELGVLGTMSRLAQVFVNLLTNAVYSIQQTPSRRGKLTLRGYRRGDRVLVEVRDTGAGIEPDHLSRLFDPFFTTKPPEHGSGLGLAICREIVQMHGGEIMVQSTIGHGATFTIDLPWADLRAQPWVRGKDPASKGAAIKGRL
ncbi:MAG: HAMP domain-containing histidine kinase, partial [Deltaproteobacteria bacterium]|nr:HAMP domain-containing histidine kinase [Deltaproteobacteria bacterium]